MYRIIVCPAISYIEPQLPAEMSTSLNNDLRYHPPGYRHTYYYKKKKWDGYKYLFNMVDQKFRTGLVWRVARRLKDDDVPYEIVDTRSKKEVISDIGNIDLGDITPFEFQLNAARATTENSHCVIASPTGTGKTIMMALMTKLHKQRTLIVVNSRVLLDQTFEFFDSVIPGGAGIMGSGDFHLADVTVATMQTLGSTLGIGKKRKPTSKAPALKDWLSNVGVVIHDEVHEADSASVNGLYGQLEANRFIGTTATPFSWAYASERGKNLEMEQHFGIKTYDSRDKVDFIKLGLTVPLYVTRFPTPSVSEFENWDPDSKHGGEDYRDVLQAQVIENEARTELLAKRVKEMYDSGMSCYVFYQRIAYGEELLAAMHKLNPVMIQGKTPRKKRNNIFKAIEAKEQLIVVSDIGSYGLNIKSLDSIMIAFPTKDARQLKGRVCRAANGKKCGYIYDPVDVVPFLNKHATLRYNQYKKDKNVIIG